MTDPKIIQYQGIGTGGGGGTHIYADLSDLIESASLQAKQFVLVTTLSALAEYADSIRDQHPAAYKAASAALTAGTTQLARTFEMPGGE